MSKIFSIVPSWEDTTKKIIEQKYVYIKVQTKNGTFWITKADVIQSGCLKVILYPDIILTQKYYGITFALTKEELCQKI